MSDMTAKDLWNYHRAQAGIFHKKAQQARRDELNMREQRRFVHALRANCAACDMRSTRDNHKAKAREYRALM